MQSTPKKKFEEKFEAKNGQWQPKKPGGWQTTPEVTIPPEAHEPWVDNMRLWAFEMRQWAQTVTGEFGELVSEVDDLRQQVHQMSELIRDLRSDVDGLGGKSTGTVA